jgi:hypothetical protein
VAQIMRASYTLLCGSRLLAPAYLVDPSFLKVIEPMSSTQYRQEGIYQNNFYDASIT